MGDADRLGSLETGKIADFIVVDRDPLAIPITDVHNVKVKSVYVDGRQVFAAPPAVGAK
jgi:predicted amidohydrolase YtcJ